MSLIQMLREPWPWYVSGPLIGLTVPILLLLGNKKLGISSTLRHMCAAILPAKIPFFQYDWKRETWNLFFVAGILVGGFIANAWLANPQPMVLNSKLMESLKTYSITNFSDQLPKELFSWKALLTIRGFIMIVVGGFLVGFGTRYAGGCTSGHAIMGISSLQWPSLVATISFFIGGMLVANYVIPYILSL